MKKLKVGMLLAVVMSVMCLFTACADDSFYGTLYSAEAFQKKSAITTAEEITEFDLDTTTRVQTLVTTTSSNEITAVFDAATGAKVFSATGNVDIESVFGGDAFVVDDAAKEKRSLRRITDGAVLAELTVSEYNRLPSSLNGITRIGGNIMWYNEVTEQIEVLIADDPFLAIPTIDLSLGYTDKYFYNVTSTHVMVYGRDLLPVAVCELDIAGMEDMSAFVLNNGNVLIQIVRSVPEDADYEFVMSDEKCSIDHYIFDVKRSKLEKFKDINFIVLALTNAVTYPEQFEDISSKVENIAMYVPFKDGGTVTVSAYKYAKLSNNLKLGESLTSKYADKRMAIPLTQVNGKKYYMAYSSSPASDGVIINEKNEFVANASMVEYNRSYIIADGAVYSYDKVKLYDYKEEGMRLHTILDDVVIFIDEDTDDVYMYVGNEIKKVGESVTVTNTRTGGPSICRVWNGNKYDYYNELGYNFMSNEESLYYAASFGDSYYMRNGAGTKIYRLHN